MKIIHGFVVVVALLILPISCAFADWFLFVDVPFDIEWTNSLNGVDFANRGGNWQFVQVSDGTEFTNQAAINAAYLVDSGSLEFSEYANSDGLNFPVGWSQFTSIPEPGSAVSVLVGMVGVGVFLFLVGRKTKKG